MPWLRVQGVRFLHDGFPARRPVFPAATPPLARACREAKPSDNRPPPSGRAAKNQNCHADCCILPGLLKAPRALAQSKSLTLARNDEMHEIPNFPFPSLNPEEPSVAAHTAEAVQAVEQEGDEQSSAEQE